MDKSRIDKLNDIHTENIVWVIYIGIIILSYYSNSKEVKYLLFDDQNSKRDYRNLMILIFCILVIIYFHFTKNSYDDYIDLKDSPNDRIRNLHFASFIASTMVLISGVIFLYIVIVDENIDVEIAFN